MKAEKKQRYKAQLFICSGKSCSKKSDPEAAKKFFKERIKEQELKTSLRACTCSCLDLCDDGPNMVIYPEGTWLTGVREDDWEEIWQKLAARLKENR